MQCLGGEQTFPIVREAISGQALWLGRSATLTLFLLIQFTGKPCSRLRDVPACKLCTMSAKKPVACKHLNPGASQEPKRSADSGLRASRANSIVCTLCPTPGGESYSAQSKASTGQSHPLPATLPSKESLPYRTMRRERGKDSKSLGWESPRSSGGLDRKQLSSLPWAVPPGLLPQQPQAGGLSGQSYHPPPRCQTAIAGDLWEKRGPQGHPWSPA